MGTHIPLRVMRNTTKARKIDCQLLPSPGDAAAQYRLNGGHITDPEQNVTDPLHDDSIKLTIRAQYFSNKYSSFEPIFYDIVNHNGALFTEALKMFIDITFRLSQT